MSIRILLARHVPDFRRNEPRNVGVIVTDGERSAARFAGEAGSGKVDGNKVRGLVGRATGIGVYREWVDFWREQLGRGASGVQDLLAEVAPNFYIAEAAEVWDDDVDDLEAIIDHYYSMLVEHAEPDDDTGLRQRVQDILERAGVTSMPGFRRQPEVTAARTPRPVKIRFPFGVQNGRLTVADHADVSRRGRVHTLLWRFEHIPNNVRRVCFYTGAGEADEDVAYVEMLASLCRAIDVNAPEAEETVLDAFR